MDPDPGSPFFVLLILISFHALFAAAEVAIISIPNSRLTKLVEEGRRSARMIAGLAGDATQLLGTTRLATTLLAFLAVGLAAGTYDTPLAGWLNGLNPAWSAPFCTSASIVLIAIGMALVILFLGELLPKAIAAQHPESIALLSVYPVKAMAFVASPLSRVATFLSSLLTGQHGHPYGPGQLFITEEQIKTMVDAGEEGGVIEEEEREMIYSIFELGDTMAREVMVPRVDIVAIEVNTSIRQALDVIIKAGHSRIPVYRHTIDNVVGILYAKDLLRFWPDIDNLRLSDILRDAYYIPETKAVDELLQELQQRKVHIAIVVDEYGGIAGLVTIEDILEEIVGEIQDEYDAEEDFMEVISPDELVVNARVDLDDVNHLMGIELPTDSSDTVGGLIYSSLGRVPVVDDTVEFQDAVLAVLSVIGRRIKKVKVTRTTPPVSEPIDNGLRFNNMSPPVLGSSHPDQRSQERSS